MAKWEGKGLQNPDHGFKSRRRLKNGLSEPILFYSETNQQNHNNTNPMERNRLWIHVHDFTSPNLAGKENHTLPFGCLI